MQFLPYITVTLALDRGEFYSYFPNDPCDGMIEAIRLAMQEGLPIRFIDREMNKTFSPDLLRAGQPKDGLILPDEHALEQIGLPTYIQAVFPALQSMESPDFHPEEPLDFHHIEPPDFHPGEPLDLHHMESMAIGGISK